MVESINDNKLKKILKFWKYIEMLDQGVINANELKSIKKCIEEEKQKQKQEKELEKITIKGIISISKIDSLLDNMKEISKYLNFDGCGNISITVGSFLEDDLLDKFYNDYNFDDLEKGINRVENKNYALLNFSINNNKYARSSLRISPIFWLMSDISCEKSLEDYTKELEQDFLKSEISQHSIFKMLKKLEGINNINIDDRCIVEFKLYNSEKIDDININIYNNFIKLDFYSKDIEMVLENFESLDIEKNYIGALLIPKNELKNNRKNILDVEELFNILSIKNMPLGRWPSSYNQSLLQQISINLSVSENYKEYFDNTGILSVDGPPGTGKTTMVKDIIAELLVKKAKLISDWDFDEPDDAFIEIEDGYYKIKDSKINNFNILISSSNNDAIKNIVNELPLKDSIGSKKEHLNEIINKGYYKEILERIDINNWANLCGVLGNKKNREKFCTIIDPILEEASKIKESNKQDLLKEYRDTREEFNYYYTQLLNIKNKLYAIEINKELEKLKLEYSKYNNVENNLKSYKKEFNKVKVSVLAEKITNQLTHNKKDINKQRKDLLNKIITKMEEIIKYDINRELINSYTFNEDIIDVAKILTTINSNKDDIKKSHLYNPYSNKEINKLRETLFVISVKLLFLFAICSDKACSNLMNMRNYIENINNKNIVNVRSLYETTFLFFPIISSTLASIQTNFKDLKERNFFGNLIIDEAGQAQPQQLIGALYRSKKTIVIGDPKQLTPIVTDGITNVLRELSKDYLVKYIDKNNSIQLFANEINQYGMEINGSNWTSLQLLVHRRCINPMFNISNEISYNGKMLHETNGLDNNLLSELIFKDKSTWLNINGVNEGNYKYYKEKQGEKVCELLEDYYKEHEKLPNLFIITPFREIRDCIREEIKSHFEKSELDYEGKELSAWVENNIGTIHSFQGKEANEVILILGCDLKLKNTRVVEDFVNTNLINVAVTRAKYRLCVIGDIRVWENNVNVLKIYEQMLSNELGEIVNIINNDNVTDKKNAIIPKCILDRNYYIVENKGTKDEDNQNVIYLDIMNKVMEKTLQEISIDTNLEDPLINVLDRLKNKYKGKNVLEENLLAPVKFISSLISNKLVNSDWDFSFAGAQLTKIVENIANYEIVDKLKENKEKIKNSNVGQHERVEKIIKQIEKSKDPELGKQISCLKEINEIDKNGSREITTEVIELFLEKFTEFKNLRNKVCHKEVFTNTDYENLKNIGYIEANCIVNKINEIFDFE